MPRSVTEQFTPSARLAVVEAQAQARALGHSQVDAEHLLIGVAATSRTLESVGADLAAITGAVERALPMREGDDAGRERLPFTPAAKRVLDRALRHHQRLGHPAITTGHLLLGILEEPKVVVVLEEVVGDVFGLAGAAERAAAEEGAGTGSAAASAELAEAAGEGASFDAPVEPVCPACRAAIAGTLRSTVVERDGWTARILFCGACGGVLTAA